MGWPFVRRRMAGELGPDWQSKFQSFERDAAAAASGAIRIPLPVAAECHLGLQYGDPLEDAEVGFRINVRCGDPGILNPFQTLEAHALVILGLRVIETQPGCDHGYRGKPSAAVGKLMSRSHYSLLY